MNLFPHNPQTYGSLATWPSPLGWWRSEFSFENISELQVVQQPFSLSGSWEVADCVQGKALWRAFGEVPALRKAGVWKPAGSHQVCPGNKSRERLDTIFNSIHHVPTYTPNSHKCCRGQSTIYHFYHLPQLNSVNMWKCVATGCKNNHFTFTTPECKDLKLRPSCTIVPAVKSRQNLSEFFISCWTPSWHPSVKME